jgi:hypothetical protein
VVEVVTRSERRHRWSEEDQARIIAVAMALEKRWKIPQAG